MEYFNWFIVPFNIGLAFVIIVVGAKFTKWLYQLPFSDKMKLAKSVFKTSLLKSANEIVTECLLHKNIFKTNKLLGFMHVSLAFGWFILIVVGHFEARVYSGIDFNFPHYPIFLRFFEHTTHHSGFAKGVNFFMDFTLAIILIGVCLAFYKRFSSKAFGLQRTTKHVLPDRLAITALWFVFPLRLLAESLTAAQYHNGSFLTQPLGNAMAYLIPVQYFEYQAWWAYSLSLTMFFISLPFSRYMHILAEPVLIIMRNAGIETSKYYTSYSEAEVQSCSRCGICLDACQLATSVNINNIQSTHLLRHVRQATLSMQVANNCLMCGKCNSVCPVGIQSTAIRQTQRHNFNKHLLKNFSYLTPVNTVKAEVLYFAGCMTHLTPLIKKAMVAILQASGSKFKFIDQDDSICCGRPLLLAGQYESAFALRNVNKAIIEASGAKLLVTSCPICYKVFKDDYKLQNIEILHHTQYIHRLVETEQIILKNTGTLVTYHDPCELGRGSNVYHEPRSVINRVADMLPQTQKFNKSACCGGSIANTTLTALQRKKIAADALKSIKINNAEMLLTACPLCKKTFEGVSEKPVADIAELVAKNLIIKPISEPKITARKPYNEIEYANENINL